MSRVTTPTSESQRHEARRRWLHTDAAGVELGISDEHVRQLIAAGELRAMDVSKPGAKRKEYRLRPEWIAEFEERRTSGPTAA